MKNTSYESIKADQAWIAVTEHLQRRNQLLADGVYFLENHPLDHSLAGRLVVLQYHLRATIRRLVCETNAAKAQAKGKPSVRQQWLIVHQLHFLLRQIDDELRKTGVRSPSFRSWMDRKQVVHSYRTQPVMYLN